jgi:hypothetical protein
MAELAYCVIVEELEDCENGKWTTEVQSRDLNNCAGTSEGVKRLAFPHYDFH